MEIAIQIQNLFKVSYSGMLNRSICSEIKRISNNKSDAEKNGKV
jgi:hypothetical protein